MKLSNLKHDLINTALIKIVFEMDRPKIKEVKRERIHDCFERNLMFWTAVHCVFFQWSCTLNMV